MTPAQWMQIQEDVAEQMKAHIRPFMTPLGTETPQTVRLVGTGNYVERERQRILLTCQHVACTQPMHYRFFGDDSIFQYSGPPWRMRSVPDRRCPDAPLRSGLERCRTSGHYDPAFKIRLQTPAATAGGTALLLRICRGKCRLRLWNSSNERSWVLLAREDRHWRRPDF